MKIISADPSCQYTAIRTSYTGPKPKWEWDSLPRGQHPNKKRGLGSLDATTILGLNRYKSKYALYLEIVGDIPKPPSAAFFDDIAEVGILLEDDVVDLYRRRTGRVLIDRGYYKRYPDGSVSRWDTRRHPKHEWMIAAVDMEVLDPGTDRSTLVHPFKELPEPTELPFPATGNGVLEAKTKDYYDQIFDEDGSPSMEILVQLQHQLAVCGAEWGSVAALVNRRFYWVDMQRSEPFIAWLIEQEEAFWEDCHLGRVPEVDSSESTSDALGKLNPMEEPGKSVTLSTKLSQRVRERYDFVEDALKAGEDEKNHLQNLIKVEMGDAEEAYTDDGNYRFTWKKQKDGEPRYVVNGKRPIEEEAVLMKLKAEYQPGRTGARTFRRAKAKKGKKKK